MLERTRLPGAIFLLVAVLAIAATQAAARECDRHLHNRWKTPYFGDTHVHTTFSLDASTQGTLMTPAEAYRFARGELVPIQPFDEQGDPLRQLQLARPLDFAMVSDHAEFFGEVTICEDPSHPNYGSLECQLYRDNPDQAFLFFNAQLSEPGSGSPKRVQRYPGVCGPDGSACVEAAKTPWGIIREAAAAAYEPCEFTTFVGYEWTGSPQAFNLHRNVIFANEQVPDVPTSYFEAPDPELLWAALDDQCHADTPGCRSTTIPHNSNVSGGLMFKTTDGNSLPFTPAYAAMRQRFEPLVEIFQHKGDSECYQLSGQGAEDELCGFEKFPYNNLIFDRFGGAGSNPPTEPDFVRDALKVGMQLESSLGVNPFKYGIIAGTDTHLGAPGSVVEEGFPGHGGAGSAPRGELPTGLTDNIAFNPGGLAVLWAAENTRSALFEAVERREAYGTSGPRITLRFFGGWKLHERICRRERRLVRRGYRRGVAMGGDLPPPPRGQKPRNPRFAVYAVKDPGAIIAPRPFPYFGEPSVPLQKIQIVKGWIDAGGQKQEAIYDVAGGNDAGVDPETCEPTAPATGTDHDELCAVWEDPDYDASLSAFYYARVVQNPTCRWATLQCNAAGVDCDAPETVTEGYEGCCDDEYPRTNQERAWSSPIWHRP